MLDYLVLYRIEGNDADRLRQRLLNSFFLAQRLQSAAVEAIYVHPLHTCARGVVRSRYIVGLRMR